MDRTALVLTVIIVGVVAYFAISKVDRPKELDADTVALEASAR